MSYCFRRTRPITCIVYGHMSTLATPRVQIIDPDVEFRETLAAYLRNCGYWVETCENLDEGLGHETKHHRLRLAPAHLDEAKRGPQG